MSVNGHESVLARAVAVVVVSHNYGRFLSECLRSVLSQSLPPAEIIVVDDSSTDDTPEIVRAFDPLGVKYLRVETRNVHQARGAGYKATHSEVLCFLDADDLLPVDYLAEGCREFHMPNVGIVYSDLEKFGAQEGRTRLSAEFDREQFERDNFLHAGSLVLREALTLSRAFERTVDPLLTQGDWFLWRKVLRDGWVARKQSSCYRYRQHEANWTAAMRQTTATYYEYAGVADEVVTLFIPLSGREKLWPGIADYLDRQEWPRDQIRLILADSSQDDGFSLAIRNWLANCDYPDVRHLRLAVSRSGLADENRHLPDVQAEVRRAVARIYSCLAREASTAFVWVIEDDIIPPADACKRLLKGFDRDTGSVSGVYDSRYDGLPCVWDRSCRHFQTRGTGLQEVFGNGFGCVLLRGGILRKTAFRATGDFDRVFYKQLHAAGLKAKVNWDVECVHRNHEVPDGIAPTKPSPISAGQVALKNQLMKVK